VRGPFELDWLGGAAERYFRRRRDASGYPWGTLDLGAYAPDLVARARLSWTHGAWSEYCSAAAFAALQGALLEAAAPVDLIGMAGEFVADEMLHTELNARVATELGGAAPLEVDWTDLAPRLDPDLTPFQRATELAVRVSCVGESLSVPLLQGARRVTRHPLVGAVLERIVRDEPPHARLGWLVLDWAADRLDAPERDRLAEAALDALAPPARQWQALRSQVTGDRTTEGFPLAHVHDLGWLDTPAYVAAARRAARDQVLRLLPGLPWLAPRRSSSRAPAGPPPAPQASLAVDRGLDTGRLTPGARIPGGPCPAFAPG